MEATLKFNLPEEQEEFDMACKSHAYRRVIEDIASYMRRRWKHEVLMVEQEHIIEEIQGKLYELLEEHKLNID